jgi:hypothetical protein
MTDIMDMPEDIWLAAGEAFDRGSPWGIAAAILAERERCTGSTEPRPLAPADGIALRDWFAGQALCGYLASVSTNEVMKLCAEGAVAAGLEAEPFIAQVAYTFADAMMAAREVDAPR